MSSPRAQLIETFRELMLPALEALGFRGFDPEQEVYRPLDDLGRSFPFGRFRRTAPDGTIEQIEIEFDSRGGCSFRVIAGRIPHNGIQHPTLGFIKTSEAWVHYLPQWAKLCRGRILPRWFRPRGDSNEARNDSVEAAIQLLCEVDQWLRSQARGAHLRIVRAYPAN